MKPEDRQMTGEDFAVTSELRLLLEQARGTLVVASGRAEEDAPCGVFRSLRGASARIEEALRHLSGANDEMEREVAAEAESSDELGIMLVDARRILGESADLADRAEHSGAANIVEEVGEATSLVIRATRQLLR